MNVRIPKKTLVDGLALLEHIIPTRSSNPILTYLPLELGKKGLLLRGTNGEVDLEASLPAEITGELLALVPAQLFFQIVRNAPGELIEMSFGDKLSLASGSFKTELALASPEGYPELAFQESKNERISARELTRAILRVRYAASLEEYRAIFRGVQLEFSPAGLRAVASDGFRLARFDLAAPSPQPRKIVVPARAADEIVRVFKDLEGELEIAASEHSLTLVGPAARMTAKLMEGQFPDYQRVIPQQFVLEASLQAEALRESLKRVSVLSDRSNHRVNLIFREDQLEINAESESGRGGEELSVNTSGTLPLEAAYNAQYLIDALAPVSGTVNLKLSGPTNPSVIQAAEDSGYLAVVVPLRV